MVFCFFSRKGHNIRLRSFNELNIYKIQTKVFMMTGTKRSKQKTFNKLQIK